jgi:hypothetical protein
MEAETRRVFVRHLPACPFALTTMGIGNGTTGFSGLKNKIKHPKTDLWAIFWDKKLRMGRETVQKPGIRD